MTTIRERHERRKTHYPSDIGKAVLAQLHADVGTLVELVDEMLAVLKEVEGCIVKHADNCQLAAVIAKVEKKVG